MLIKIEELKEKIINKQAKEMHIELNGMVKTQLKIIKPDIKITKEAVIISSKQDRTQKIELDLHQIMKIEKIIESVFYIEFDYLQSVTITIVNLVENGEDK